MGNFKNLDLFSGHGNFHCDTRKLSKEIACNSVELD